MTAFLRAHMCTLELSREVGPRCAADPEVLPEKEMRIFFERPLRKCDFKLQPFPDEWLDANPVCSTGVNTYPSASKIQNMLLYSDDTTTSIFPPRTNLRWSVRFALFLPVCVCVCLMSIRCNFVMLINNKI